MQKHQEWLDNRNYAQHLHHLQKIRVRKSRGATAIHPKTANKKKKSRLPISASPSK